MSQYRITFANYSATPNRVAELLKNFYWREGIEPSSWADFDGDIKIKEESPRGGDCFTIELPPALEKPTISFLNEKKFTANIRSIEVLLTHENYESVSITNRFLEKHMIGEIVKLVEY